MFPSLIGTANVLQFLIYTKEFNKNLNIFVSEVARWMCDGKCTMDIDKLSTLLRDALASQDCVSLPGIGTFTAEDESASFSDRGYTVNPPYRKLSFLAGAGETSPLEAEGLEECLAELNETLQRERAVVLEGLGKLRLTSKGELFFVSDPDPDIFPAGFGLEPVSMKAHVALDNEAQTTPDASTTAPNAAEPNSAEPTVTEPQSDVQPQASEAPTTETPAKPRKKHGFLRFVVWLIVVLVLAAAAFRLAAYLAPDFIDSLLYTPEELKLLGK